MKLIIFLLLLSGSCFGQDSLIARFFEGRNIGCAVYHPGMTCDGKKISEIKYDWEGFRFIGPKEIECSHRWVELHQDTVESEIVDIDYSQPAYPLNIEPEPGKDRFEESIPLICLICHQEKKRVIHYKRYK